MRRLRARTSLLAEFAAVSFVALVLLGVVLAQTFLRTMRQEERTRATQVAMLTAKADVKPKIPVDELDATLGHGEAASLDAKLRAFSEKEGVSNVTVWGRDSEVLYSTEEALAGKVVEEQQVIEKALEGTTTTDVSRTTPAGTTAARDLLQVFVPLRTSSGLTAGVLEVDFDYTSFAAGAEQDRRTVLTVLGGSLTLIYALMLFTVARSTRTHHR